MKLRSSTLVLVLSAFVLACGGSDGPAATPPPPPPPPAAPPPDADVVIEMEDDNGANERFVDPQGRTNEQASVTVSVGQTVGFVNRGDVQHTATSTDEPAGGDAFDSGTMNPGDTFTFTPMVEGTYVFRCNFHPLTMLDATIVVVP